MIKKFFLFILDSIQALVLSLSVFVLLYLFIAQPNQVKGNSMVPNFIDKEFLLTDKITYRLREPIRGDVVVFKAPPSEACSEEECEYIKRVIGMPGETISLKDGKVYINDLLLDENYLPSDFVTDPGNYLAVGISITVPEGNYILMGDNRSHSRDSREFGPINKKSIVGRAFFSYWPPDSFGVIPKISYAF